MGDKKVAIMQPYIFPYLGYFQLINAVDIFVFYDDVNFIKQGWINRNKILVNGKGTLFTVPISGVSSFELIHNTEINRKMYGVWRKKILKSITQSYSKAPYFEQVKPVIERVLGKEYQNISDLAIMSIKEVLSYLGMQKKTFISSQVFGETKGVEKADRIIEICRKIDAQHYVNPSGGINIYDKDYFASQNITLSFIKNELPEYQQFGKPFISGLSIIDIVMFNSIEECKKMLNTYNYE